MKDKVRGRSHLSPVTPTTESLWPRAPAPPTHWRLGTAPSKASVFLPFTMRLKTDSTITPPPPPPVCLLTKAVPSPILPPTGRGHSHHTASLVQLAFFLKRSRKESPWKDREARKGRGSPEIIFWIDLFWVWGDTPRGLLLVPQPESRAGQGKHSGEFWIAQ